MKVYVASSWRNLHQPAVVTVLRQAGHEVYDFRDSDGFHWSDLDQDWKTWSPERFRAVLRQHPVARRGFERDMDALRWCDACVLVQPCGRSAHLELGWAVGQGKRTAILLRDGEPELMYRMVDHLATSLGTLALWLAGTEVPS